MKMKMNNIRIKILLAIFAVVLLWQIFKLRSSPPKTLEVLIDEEEEEKEKNQQVLVTVYYEALCSDSRNFITKQLVPTFDSIEDYIELQLIPYGKAETIATNDDYMFKCQHGEVECEANIIHACSINKIRDSRKQLKVIACMIKNNIHPLSILKSCASDMEEYKDVLNCSQTIEGRRLLMKYGTITNELNPKVSFIPTITLDNEFDNQILILKNLLLQVCQRIEAPPPECTS